MLKSMVKLPLVSLLFIASFVPSSIAADGISDGGKVVHVASVDGALLFSVAGGSSSNRPACASTARFSAAEKSIHAAVVLTAFSTGKTLANIHGKGTCTLWPNAEDIRWIEVCPLNGCP